MIKKHFKQCFKQLFIHKKKKEKKFKNITRDDGMKSVLEKRATPFLGSISEQFCESWFFSIKQKNKK